MSKGVSRHGAQRKWISQGDVRFKADLIGGEAEAETLVSLFLSSCLNITEFEAGFVAYGVHTAENPFCYSLNFLKEGESFISLYESMCSVKVKHSEYSDFGGKLNYIDNVYKEVLGYSCKRWLLRVLTLDVMFRNTDRHLANLGFIADSQGNLRLAPIFDNGLALGVSEGTYFDLSNTISGLGFMIKPYQLTAKYLERYINPSYFAFSVVKFISRFKQESVPKNNLLLAFLNILVHYYPKDTLGVDTKKALESYFGPFTKKRFL